MTHPIRILQFSDSHLFGKDGKTICGLDPSQTFSQTLTLARKTDWPVDAVFLTGDNSQDATIESYNRLLILLKDKLLDKESVPVYCLPGNHDDPKVMEKSFSNSAIQVVKEFVMGPWAFVFLDSNIPGSPKGWLAPNELDFIEKSLKNLKDKMVIVALHHHVYPVGSAWMDTMVVGNGREFLDLLKIHKNVKGVIYGHVHQDVVVEMNGMKLMAAPSTCFQFKPNSPTFGLDQTAPGYRWFQLWSDGRIDTRVSRLPSVPQELDLQTLGY